MKSAILFPYGIRVLNDPETAGEPEKYADLDYLALCNSAVRVMDDVTEVGIVSRYGELGMKYGLPAVHVYGTSMGVELLRRESSVAIRIMLLLTIVLVCFAFYGFSRSKIKRMVNDALKEFEIEDKAKAYPNELSGGQQQRVAIARAVVKRPRVILADEPTGALDEATGEAVQDIFRRLNEKGTTVIIVTHDAKVAEGCERMIRLRDGNVWNDSLQPVCPDEEGGIL